MEGVVNSIMALGEALFELSDVDQALKSFCEALDVMKASGRDDDMVKACQRCIDQLVRQKETGSPVPPENTFVDDCVTDFVAIADGYNELIEIFKRFIIQIFSSIIRYPFLPLGRVIIIFYQSF